VARSQIIYLAFGAQRVSWWTIVISFLIGRRRFSRSARTLFFFCPVFPGHTGVRNASSSSPLLLWGSPQVCPSGIRLSTDTCCIFCFLFNTQGPSGHCCVLFLFWIRRVPTFFLLFPRSVPGPLFSRIGIKNPFYPTDSEPSFVLSTLFDFQR